MKVEVGVPEGKYCSDYAKSIQSCRFLEVKSLEQLWGFNNFYRCLIFEWDLDSEIGFGVLKCDKCRKESKDG